MDTYKELMLWRRLGEAYAAVRDHLDRELSAVADISLSEFEVLRLLIENGGAMRMSELAARSRASRSGLTRRVDRLERRGLVYRRPVDGDRRGLEAALTEDGAGTCNELTPIYVRELRARCLGRLEADEITSMVGLLDRIL